MSHIPFDRAPLLTDEDQRRQPAIDAGQLMRLLMIFLVCVLALVLVAHRGGDNGRDKMATEQLPSGPADGSVSG